VFGGLGMATVFTLVLIPVLYSLLAPFRAPRADAGLRLHQELSESEQAADLAFGKSEE
jgi:HAE1 family hydrophobic/amphiphilic exporter-1